MSHTWSGNVTYYHVSHSNLLHMLFTARVLFSTKFLAYIPISLFLNVLMNATAIAA